MWTTDSEILLPGGIFRARSGPLTLTVRNANNHQLTWAVVVTAIWAVTDYMVQKDQFGTVVFDIFDGANQVGQGSIS